MIALLAIILRARSIALLLGVLGCAVCAGAGEPFPARAPVAGPRDWSTAERPIEKPLRRITPQGTAGETDAGGRGVPSIGSMVYGLAIVLFAIFVAARLWKTHGSHPPATVADGSMQVLGRCRIEPRQSLYLVQVGARVLVVGSSSGNLAPIAEIADPVEVDLIVGASKTQSGTSPFGRLFTGRSPDAAPENAVNTAGNISANAAGARVSSFAASFGAAVADAVPPRAPASQRPSPEQRLADRLRSRSVSEEADHAA